MPALASTPSAATPSPLPAAQEPPKVSGTHRATTAKPAHRGGERLPVLDGLRLVAALSVVLCHYFVLPHNYHIWGVFPQTFAPGVTKVAGYGWLGVEFFFLISGFVICMSSYGRTVTDFFISRVSRLYPAYWFAVLLCAAVIRLHPLDHINNHADVSPRAVLANLTMMPGQMHVGLIEGVAWTLWVEARFYLLIGVLLVIGMSYRSLVSFCGVWMMATLITVELKNPVMDEIVMSKFSGLFVAGIAVYLMRRFGQNLVLWGLLGFAWMVQLTMLNLRVTARTRETGVHVSWTVSAALLTAALIALLLVAIGPLGRIKWSWLTTAGALTYPLYLVHQNLGHVMIAELTMHASGIGRPAILTLTVITMLLLAWLIYRFVERPLARFIKIGLKKGIRPPQAA